MKHFLLPALLLFSVSSYAQIYRAEQGTPVNFSRLEISVGMGLTSSSLQDPSGDTIIHDKNFTDFRLLYGLSSRFALGPAIYFSNKQDNQPLISSYKTRRYSALVCGSRSRRNEKVYLLFAVVGRFCHKPLFNVRVGNRG